MATENLNLKPVDPVAMYPCGGPIVNSKTNVTTWASVVLCGETYEHADGAVEGCISGAHVCLSSFRRTPDESDLHLSLEGPTGQLTLIMSASAAREMANNILMATDPERN
jgi:hypothetical protein